MPRSFTTGLNGQLTTNGAYPGWLVELTLPSQVLRLTDLDTGFTYGGNTFAAADVSVTGVDWNGGISRSANIELGDASLAYWALALNLEFADAPARLWSAYAGAPGEATPVWSGRVASPKRGPLSVLLSLHNESDTRSAPRDRIQYLVPAAFLLPSGSVILINGQRWILDRTKQ